MIVDSHQHFWDLEKVEYPWLVPEYGPIYRTFGPEELAPQLAAAGIDQTVLVQAANSFEDTDSMLDLAATYDWIGAVVGWVPLEDGAATAAALDERYGNEALLKGVRHLNHEETDPDWLMRRAVLEGLKVLEARGLVFEVVAIHPLHLEHVPALADACPNLQIVIDHLAKPPISSGEYSGWRAEILAAAQRPNVHAKISGLNTTADWEHWSGDDHVEPIGYALDAFGPRRLMFGSDWPVATLAGDYAKVWTETGRALDSLGIQGADRAAILGTNAEELYDMVAA